MTDQHERTEMLAADLCVALQNLIDDAERRPKA